MNEENVMAMNKEQYAELIMQLVDRCNNLDTLDMVYRILAKSA